MVHQLGQRIIFINKGIEAVRNFSLDHNTEIEIMLHIAQPENAIWWFNQANSNGVTNYDWIDFILSRLVPI